MIRCPDPALMASFVDNRTSNAETNILINHFAECDECRDWLGAVVRDRQELQLEEEPVKNLRRELIIVLVILTLLSFAWAASGQTVVYTNQGSVVVREVRTVRPAAPVPASIQRRADELQVYGQVLLELRTRTRLVPHQQVALPTIVPQRTVVAPPMAPLFVDGLYVGPSPSGSWTAVTTKIPTIRVIR